MTLDSLYIGVPIGAFFCFLFIFFSFLNAGDAKPVRYFRQILLSCLIWTGGVVMMRMQIMPGMRFWFHVSVFGFLTVPIFDVCIFILYVGDQKEWFPDRILHSYCGGNGDQCCHRSIYPGTGYYPVCRWKHWICLSSILGKLFICSCGGRCDRLYDSFGAQGNRQ